MEKYQGKLSRIISFKHNEQLHRVWKTTKIIHANTNSIVSAHRKTKVFEKNGRSWYTSEPAVCYFYTDRWYNVISMIKKDGIYYYCNVSSPISIDDEGLKYIDYDLDVKFFPNGTYVILDENEFKKNSQLMAYQKDLIDILESQVSKIIDDFNNQRAPFNKNDVMIDYKKYTSNRGKK